MSRLKTSKEINMQFYLFEDNIFTLNKPEAFYLFNSELNDIRTTSLLEVIGYQLFTVCSILLEKPYIQYQSDSKFAKTLAEFVKSNSDEFYERLKESERGDKSRNPRAKLIIVDRSFDLIAPIQHDFSYQTLVYDTNESEGEKKVLDVTSDVDEDISMKVELDETDEIWMKFKAKHLAETLTSLSSEISNFVDNDKTEQIKNGENFDMQEALEAATTYKELVKKYLLHLQLSQEVMSNFTACKWKDLISIEQKIITGVDELGREVTNIDIIRGITKISKDLTREDHTRLLIQYLTCYELSEKDRYNMITSIQNDAFEAILENLPYFFPEFEEGKKLQRRAEKISESEFSTYKKKLDESDYDILRSTTKLSKIAISSFNDELSEVEFPFLGDAPAITSNAKRRGRQRRDNNDISNILSNPRIILFVLGGLSHHEIVSLQKIQEEGAVQCQIIAGSSYINRPSEFLNMMKDIQKYNLKNNPFSRREEPPRGRFEESKQ
eukprot:CAMPEP_0197000166 /NCGR_PEP_ID=MMETSP1380-20130617/5172_1 /TAXON_ID=5936 /ORGANISM="Euplotes crassus, Strain CT5" /LENGTH=495 /DNA_ID=CAMNT_0042417361 /DNA_START=399 /DNA_END=1886 /DNA_ORIENTATION=-